MAFAGTVIGRGIIPVSLDPTAIGGQVAGLQGAMAGKFGAIGKVAGGAFAIGAGAAIGGKVLFDLGAEFDDAFDTIRVGTGQTGKSLIGLQKDFKEVARNGPDSFGLVGTAIADLNQRLDLSGKPLQALSRQILDLSRITGTDLSTNIQTLTRVFGDWSIPTKDMTGALDELFRASQATGTPIDRLAAVMTKFGSPLRQLGFDFETTAALVGKFEKEGVNTELVLGSMRIALGKMAKSGEPAQETLKRVTDEIKNAGSTSEANGKAIELFGARAGPDMAAAIREGRFEIRDLYKQIADGKDTIQTATEDTSDFAEEWKRLKNELKVSSEPAATATFSGLSKALKFLRTDGIPSLRKFNEESNRQLGGVKLNSKTAGAAFDSVGRKLNSLKSKAREGFAAIRVSASSGWSSAVATTRSKGSELIGFVQGLPGRIKGAFGGLGSLLSSAGSELIGGLLGGIKSRFNEVKTTLQNLTSQLPSWKGPMEVDQSILFDSGVAVMGGFVRGLESERDTRRRFLGRVTANLPRDVKAAPSAKTATGNGGITRSDLEWHVRQLASLMGLATDGAINDQLAFAGTTSRMAR